MTVVPGMCADMRMIERLAPTSVAIRVARVAPDFATSTATAHTPCPLDRQLAHAEALTPVVRFAAVPVLHAAVQARVQSCATVPHRRD